MPSRKASFTLVAAFLGGIGGVIWGLLSRGPTDDKLGVPGDAEGAAATGASGDKGQRRSPRAPRFETPAVPHSGLESQPGAPGYDPAKLASLVGLKRVADAEPRDPAWAADMEQRLGKVMIADMETLLPDAGDYSFECRTRTCAFRWSSTDVSPRDMGWKIIDVLLSLYAPGVTLNNSTKDRGEVLFAFPGPSEDVVRFAQEYRRAALERWRAGHVPPGITRYDLPPTRIPAL